MASAFALNAIFGAKDVSAVVEWFCAAIAMDRLRKILAAGGYVPNVMMQEVRSVDVSGSSAFGITSWKLGR